MELKKLYCHWDLYRFLKEDDAIDNCICLAHNINGVYYDLRVYLWKEQDKYIVRIYKTENDDDFDEFNFDNFENAHEFVDTLSWKHPEYKERPFVEVKSK